MDYENEEEQDLSLKEIEFLRPILSEAVAKAISLDHEMIIVVKEKNVESSKLIPITLATVSHFANFYCIHQYLSPQTGKTTFFGPIVSIFKIADSTRLVKILDAKKYIEKRMPGYLNHFVEHNHGVTIPGVQRKGVEL